MKPLKRKRFQHAKFDSDAYQIIKSIQSKKMLPEAQIVGLIAYGKEKGMLRKRTRDALNSLSQPKTRVRKQTRNREDSSDQSYEDGSSSESFDEGVHV